MKYFLVVFLLLALSTSSFAVLLNIPTEELISDSDLVVVGTLTDVAEFTWDGTDYSTGVIDISRVVAGNVRSLSGKKISAGDSVIVKWEKSSMFACTANMHKSAVDVEGVWLLNVEDNFARADYPGRFISNGETSDVADIINGGTKVREGDKQATLMSEYSELAETAKAINSVVFEPAKIKGYAPHSALLVLIVALGLFVILYRKRLMRRIRWVR